MRCVNEYLRYWRRPSGRRSRPLSRPPCGSTSTKSLASPRLLRLNACAAFCDSLLLLLARPCVRRPVHVFVCVYNISGHSPPMHVAEQNYLEMERRVHEIECMYAARVRLFLAYFRPSVRPRIRLPSHSPSPAIFFSSFADPCGMSGRCAVLPCSVLRVCVRVRFAH